MQGQDRHVDEHDDQNAESDRATYILRCGKEPRRERLSVSWKCPLLLVAMKNPNELFRHDDSAVHDHAEVDGAQAHEIRRQAKSAHADERKEQRQGNGGSDEERRADIAEEEQQNADDEETALQQVRAHGVQRPVDKPRLIVVRRDLHTRRQGAVDLSHAVPDALHYVAAVRPFEAHDHGSDHFTPCVASHSALAQLRSIVDLRDVADGYGYARARGPNDGLPDVCRPLRHPEIAKDVLLISVRDIASRGDTVGGLECVGEIVERESVTHQPLRICRHVHLSHVSAEGVDAGDARYAPQLGLDDAILKRAQLHEIQAAAFDRILIEFADGSSQWRKRYGRCWRQLLTSVLQLLRHQRSGEVVVRAVLEHHADDGEPVAAQGSHFRDAREAVE